MDWRVKYKLFQLGTRISFLPLVIVFSVLVCGSELPSAAYEHNVYIDPNNGTDNQECLISNSSDIPCHSLNWAFNVSHRASSTHYVLLTGTHYINQSIPTFEDLNMIAFSGSGSSYNDTVIHCTSNTAGLAFENVTDIAFSSITFFNCSAIRNSTSKDFYLENSTYTAYKFYVALYFYSCQNVNMSLIKVDSSPNATGVVMYDTDGTNIITNCVFSNNTVDPENREYPGGGGFYVEFTYCIPGDSRCGSNLSSAISHTSRNKNSHYTFDSCIFIENRANSSDTGDNSTYIVPFHADHDAFGRGGGLSIFMKGDANNNLFSISHCNFTKNSALWGAGLFVEFHDETFENKVVVVNSRMEANECYFDVNSGTSGGGMRIGHYVYGRESGRESGTSNRSGNHVIINHCYFINNAALDGGGLSISPTVQNGGPNQVATVDVVHSNFQTNTAKLGAAIHIDRFVMILDGYIIKVNITNCVFNSNTVHYAKYIKKHFFQPHNAYQIGVGAVYVNQVPVSFISTSFYDNVGSAIAAVGTYLNFSNCVATFRNNTGNKGGAIALLGAAYIVVNDQTYLRFINNTATLYGGALYNKYIERENLVSYTNCFIRHVDYFKRPENWKTKFIFVQNTDQGGTHKNAIHTTSILPCSRAGGSGISKNKSTIFCWNSSNWSYNSSGNCSEYISSDVGEITFPMEAGNAIDAFPGQEFSIPITLKDDLITNVDNQTIFSATTKNGSQVSYVWGEKAVLNGQENENISLLLDSLGDRIWHVNLMIELQPCPPGFKIDNDLNQCVCAGQYGRALNCDPDTFKAYLEEGNWMGTIAGNKTYFVSFCPPNYCGLSRPETALPKTAIELQEVICESNNRTNTVCGECLPGFGVAVNSPSYQCINCTDEDFGLNIVKYISAVYIPLTAVFTLIILFNIRLTSAPANAFILYSQVIASTFDLYADGQISVSLFTGDNSSALELTKGFQIPYGIFNLQFVERFIPPLCLGYLNTLDVFLLDYAVALFPLVMIILVLTAIKLKECITTRCLCNKSTRRRIRHVPEFAKAHTSRRRWNSDEAILPAFSAFLLLSYTKFTTTSSYMLLSQPLLNEDGSSIGVYHVYYAGQYTTDDFTYKTRYLLPACILYATFVVIPPILLLDFPRRLFEWCISKVDCLWRCYPADKVHILLDTFQGCYKNKMRFFAGLYFVFRLVISTSYIGTHNWFDQYAVQQVACAVIVALLAICQPYNEQNKIFNIVDVLIFTNLGILNALSNYALSQSEPTLPPVSKFIFVIQYILVFLPLVYMLIYIIWWFLEPHIKRGLCSLKAGILGKLEHRGNRLMNGVASDGDAEQTETDHRVFSESMEGSVDIQSEEEALLRRAEGVNRYRPYTSSVVEIGRSEDVTVVSSNESVQSKLSSHENHSSDSVFT